MNTIWRMSRRSLLGTTAALGSTLILPGKAPAQGGAKPFAGTTLNVSCWSAPTPSGCRNTCPSSPS